MIYIDAIMTKCNSSSQLKIKKIIIKIYCLSPVLSNTFCAYESYIACFSCTWCRSFYSKKSTLTQLPIPAESKDELQNESDSDDEEYIPSKA